MNEKPRAVPVIRRLSADHVLRNRSVVGIGVGSLLSDTGHEMATAALPGFLRSIGATAAALGAIEGTADATLSAAKAAGGVLADRPSVDRREVTAGGYAITALGHASFALATTWPVIAVAHGVSWIARGGKAPARDSLLSGAVSDAQLGRAFGVERTMDSLGALLGPLLAAPLIVTIGYRWLFGVSVIPGLFAALAVLMLVSETPRIQRAVGHARGVMRELLTTPGPYRRLLLGVGLYGVGNFSATLLILRATDLLHGAGRSTADAAAIAVLLYAAHNAANSVAAYPAGALADRFGRRALLIAGIAVFALACVAFIPSSSNIALLGALSPWLARRRAWSKPPRDPTPPSFLSRRCADGASASSASSKESGTSSQASSLAFSLRSPIPPGASRSPRSSPAPVRLF